LRCCVDSVSDWQGIELGTIFNIQRDKIDLEDGKMGEDVCIEIRQSDDKQQYSYERHFTLEDKLYSKVRSGRLVLLNWVFLCVNVVVLILVLAWCWF
jgi:hypothetical protein